MHEPTALHDPQGATQRPSRPPAPVRGPTQGEGGRAAVLAVPAARRADPDTTAQRQAVSVRAAYAFGDWPPAARLAELNRDELAEASFLASTSMRRRALNLPWRPGHTWAPDERPFFQADASGIACRHCGLVTIYHDAATARCSDLALRAAWGDR